MRHAREDYNRIQDPEGKIPDDEPVFLLRGRDPLAFKAVMFYARLCEDAGLDPMMVEVCRSHATEMHNVSEIRMPDLVGGNFHRHARVKVKSELIDTTGIISGYSRVKGMYVIQEEETGKSILASRETLSLCPE